MDRPGLRFAWGTVAVHRCACRSATLLAVSDDSAVAASVAGAGSAAMATVAVLGVAVVEID
jgi:hypothetical protein